MCIETNVSQFSKGFPFDDSDSRVFPAIEVLVRCVNMQKYLQVRNKIRHELIFAFEESISDIVSELSNQKELDIFKTDMDLIFWSPDKRQLQTTK